VPVIDRHVNVAEMRRYIDGGVAEYRHDSQILGPELNDDDAASERSG
jgi:hypothetical protein